MDVLNLKLKRTVEILLSQTTQTRKAFAFIESCPQLNSLDDMLRKESWHEVKAGSKKDDILLILSATTNYQTNLSGILDAGDKKPDFLLLFFNTDKDKKTIFPLIEDKGYRVFREIGAFVFFFLFKDTMKYESELLAAGAPETSKALAGSKWETHPLTQQNPSRFVSLPARDLLKANRFDIAIKVHYARLWLTGCAKEWREHAYYEQALRITGPGKEIKEHDGSGKEGMEAFLESFHSLIKEKNTASFPLFPIDKNKTALDGAHRIAAGILKGQTIKCIQIDAESTMPSTTDYYSGIEHGHPPCPKEIIDEASIEYCRIKNTTAIALIFPCVPKATKAIEALSEISDIVYQKNIFMTPSAGGALLRQVYIGQPWMNWSEHKSGFLHKKQSCFPFSGELRALLIDNFEPRDLRLVKSKIREFYKLDNHSIHITDSPEETLQIAQVLFNQNSLSVLQRGNEEYLEKFHEKLFRFKDWMLINDINPEHTALDSSSVLSALGLRECRDLDFLFHGDPKTLPPTPTGIDCHNDIACHYDHPIDEIVGDPRLHFWYMGVKFCAPELVYQMKLNRNENKDRMDLKLMKAVLQPTSSELINKTRVFLAKIIWSFRSISNIYIRKIKKRIILLLRKLKLRDN